MNANTSDFQLLAEYTRLGSEEAFAKLVRRYVDLVYSAALRQVRSPVLAEEIAQSVFTDLWRNAGKLKPETVLTAWLYRVTRCTAIDLVRRESRRKLREQIALEMPEMNTTESPAWSEFEPLLDEAMDALEESDRTAILMRYFENKSLREVGQSLGTSEDAAQKRVSRAVEQLRRFYSQRGVATAAASLAAALAANAVQSAPLGLSSTISTAVSVSGAALLHTTTIAATKTVLMTTMQKALITIAITATVGTVIYAAREVSSAQDKVTYIQAQQAPLNEEIQRLKQERDKSATSLAASLQENQTLRQTTGELARLRAEAARWRTDGRELARLKAAEGSPTANDPATDAALKTWAARATQLKQHLAQMPERGIPEVALVTERDWFDAVKNMKALETDADYREALQSLRRSAKMEFARMLQQALKGYLSSHDGILPTELSELKPHFSAPVSDAILARWSLLQTGRLSELPEGDRLVAEIAPPVDEEYDTVMKLGINGISTTSIDTSEETLKQAGIQYAQAHNGLLPTDPAQLTPYLQKPVDPAKVRKLLSAIPPGVTTLEQLKASGVLPK